MKSTKCTAQCEHLRSVRYGFGGEQLTAVYNGRDKYAACALAPQRTMHMGSLPVCPFAEED